MIGRDKVWFIVDTNSLICNHRTAEHIVPSRNLARGVLGKMSESIKKSAQNPCVVRFYGKNSGGRRQIAIVSKQTRSAMIRSHSNILEDKAANEEVHFVGKRIKAISKSCRLRQRIEVFCKSIAGRATAIFFRAVLRNRT